MIFPTLKLC